MDQSTQLLALIGLAALGILAVVGHPAPRPRRRRGSPRESPFAVVHRRHETMPVVRDSATW